MDKIAKHWADKKELVRQLMEEPVTGSQFPLTDIVGEILNKKERLLAAAKNAPCYVFDRKNLLGAIHAFKTHFTKYVPRCTFYYAVKVNHYHEILKATFAEGFGADVSSGRELDLALKAGAKNIVFSGPGKTLSELSMAIDHSEVTTVNIDSFGELEKLASLLKTTSKKVRAGVRISFESHGSWTKFGIPLSSLNTFFNEASKIPALRLEGIQFHISWNEDATPYQKAIRELASYLSRQLEPRFLNHIDFIDIGGGFRPYQSEGFYPEDTPVGAAVQAACDAFDTDPQFTVPYLITPSVPVSEYAKGIGAAIDEHLAPLKQFSYYIEPGRIICNSALHVALTVEDVKSDRCVITNGGTNIIGFERFEFDYFPLINLTNPSRTEIPCTVYGSLCMPQDYWGHYIFASKVEPGDVIIVPYQGALTYANMQGFIKGEVPVIEL